ncbi:unnamed protein product [Ilex paraguariensis]|uniref:Structural maintenance of chromosomes protein 3 n=1 Tax=Ilex paraguariensis TaxID=185542 RepID=A0ABC8U527_9AQUA
MLEFLKNLIALTDIRLMDFSASYYYMKNLRGLFLMALGQDWIVMFIFDIRRGLNTVRRICREYEISGVFGPIFELLDCDEKFFTAVEVTAGNSLFHVVVENDGISTQIIRHLNAQKGGRVTFIPLNRVKAPQVAYPESSDVIPLLKKLRFSRDYTPAFAQVFARTVICRDLDVATRVARSDGLDCITMEGDQVSKKGGMTGGFYDYRRSKLKFMNVIRQNTKSINMKEDELEKTLEDDYQRTLQDEAKELEQLLGKRNMLLTKQEEYSKKIRELGPLSSDAFETYKRRSIKELYKMLHKCNEQLQQFSHVNKKALDQYVNFTEQREELQRRQAELDAGDEKIKELISVLDQRKDESIERTFKGVAKHFREVFSELVQGGHGFLVMMKKKFLLFVVMDILIYVS